MKDLEKTRLRGDLSIIFLLKTPNLLVSIFYQKLINAYMKYQVDQLFQTATFTLRIHLHF